MASCAAGKTSRVYGQYTELICKLMIRTWGYLFEANEKKNIKIHVNPAKFTSLLCGLCYTITSVGGEILVTWRIIIFTSSTIHVWLLQFVFWHFFMFLRL